MYMMSGKFSVSDRTRSFRYAFEGIWNMLKSQHNTWLHAVATFCIVIAGIILHLTPLEWCLIVLAIVSVWTAEAINTAFEFLCDVASPDFHPLVKKSKDIAATGAAIIGLLIFAPKVAKIFE